MRRIGLVGCGVMGRRYARQLSQRASLFFYSRSRHSAEKFQKGFQGEAIFDRFEDMLAAPEIEAVVIASPPECHHEQVIGALEAGKSVLVEKPMCVTPQQIDDIEQVLAGQRRPFLMAAENYYYKPLVALLKRLISEGFIGTLQSVDVKKLFSPNVVGWRSHCGALLEGGIHFIALISALVDAAPHEVAVEFPGHQPGQRERRSIVWLKYPNGAVATLRYAWDMPSLTRGTFQHSYIVGDRGRITFESNGLYVWLGAERKRRLYLPHLRDFMGYDRMIQDFLTCLEDRSRRPYSDFDKAKRDLQIVFAAYRNL